MFNCDGLKRVEILPSHDPSAKSYRCGSNAFNEVAYLWLIFMGIFIILMIIANRLSKSKLIFENIRKWLMLNNSSTSLCASFFLFFGETESTTVAIASQTQATLWSLYNSHRQIFNIILSLRQFSRVTFLVTAACTLFLFPVYLCMSLMFDSYTYEYAWTTSAVLLSGETAGLVILFSFITFLILIGLICYYKLSSDTVEYDSNVVVFSSPNIRKEGVGRFVENEKETNKNMPGFTVESSNRQFTGNKITQKQRFFVNLLVITTNCVTTLAVSAAYVYIYSYVTNADTTPAYHIIIQIIFAAYKALWTSLQ